MVRPSAQNGSAPATSAPNVSSHCPGAMRTWPNTAPKAKSSRITTAPNTRETAPLAKKYAPMGMGLARFTSSQPSPRSTAIPTPNAYSVEPMMANAPYVAIR